MFKNNQKSTPMYFPKVLRIISTTSQWLCYAHLSISKPINMDRRFMRLCVAKIGCLAKVEDSAIKTIKEWWVMDLKLTIRADWILIGQNVTKVDSSREGWCAVGWTRLGLFSQERWKLGSYLKEIFQAINILCEWTSVLNYYNKNTIFFLPWLVWLSGLSAGLRTGGSPVRFPVRAACLGCRPGPQLAVRKRHPHIAVSLPLFLPSFPSL